MYKYRGDVSPTRNTFTVLKRGPTTHTYRQSGDSRHLFLLNPYGHTVKGPHTVYEIKVVQWDYPGLLFRTQCRLLSRLSNQSPPAVEGRTRVVDVYTGPEGPLDPARGSTPLGGGDVMLPGAEGRDRDLSMVPFWVSSLCRPNSLRLVGQYPL